MTNLKLNHRHAVISFLSGKIEEMHYQLSEVIAHCDTSLQRFENGEQMPMYEARRICFSFSAFANVLQTLKDIARNFLGDQNPGASIGKLRHGTFMLDTRNAMTHDGNPIVDAWVDGRYYVPANILRFDNKGALVTIRAPKEDIRTVCVEFATDICLYLRDLLLKAKSARQDESLPPPNIEQVEGFLTSHVVPDFVRQLFAENREEIRESLVKFRPAPLETALFSVQRLEEYCAELVKAQRLGPAR